MNPLSLGFSKKTCISASSLKIIASEHRIPGWTIFLLSLLLCFSFVAFHFILIHSFHVSSEIPTGHCRLSTFPIRAFNTSLILNSLTCLVSVSHPTSSDCFFSSEYVVFFFPAFLYAL